MKKIGLICLFLSGLFIDVNMSSFSFSLKWNYSLTAADPTPTELYHCKDEFGEYISNLPCDFDGGTRACDSCYAQMEYDEYEDCFLCPNVSYCCGCENYVHMLTHKCPNADNGDDDVDDGTGSFLLINTGGGMKLDGGDIVCPVCHKNPCKCCPKCHKYPCQCCCSVCHLDPCKCCTKCHKYPCQCPTEEPHKKDAQRFRHVTDSVFNDIDKSTDYAKNPACNKGVQEAFRGLYGFLPPELDGQADAIARRLQNEDYCHWHVISQKEANSYADNGYFVMFVAPAVKESELDPVKEAGQEPKKYGHMCTVLPGYEGENWKSIHVMDTGYWVSGSMSTRAIDQNSFGTSIGRVYMNHGNFYYYDPSMCNE